MRHWFELFQHASSRSLIFSRSWPPRLSPRSRAALERLKHAGAGERHPPSAWRRQVLVDLLPFENFRAEGLVPRPA